MMHYLQQLKGSRRNREFSPVFCVPLQPPHSYFHSFVVRYLLNTFTLSCNSLQFLLTLSVLGILIIIYQFTNYTECCCTCIVLNNSSQYSSQYLSLSIEVLTHQASLLVCTYHFMILYFVQHCELIVYFTGQSTIKELLLMLLHIYLLEQLTHCWEVGSKIAGLSNLILIVTLCSVLCH